MRRILAFLLALLPLPAAALEVRVHPGEVVYAYEVEPARGLFDVWASKAGRCRQDGS